MLEVNYYFLPDDMSSKELVEVPFEHWNIYADVVEIVYPDKVIEWYVH